MHKIATAKVERGLIDLDYSIKKNIENLAEFKNTTPSNLTACVLDRPRHKKIIEDLSKLKVKIKLITDGDVAGALLVTKPIYNVDIYLGIGGGPEGVLAAAALDAYECHFQGKFIFDNENDIKVAKEMGITDLNRKYEINEIVKGDAIFCATAITDTMAMKGVKSEDDHYYMTETLVTHKLARENSMSIEKRRIIFDHLKN
jgi:fructose-1,6-bisphosphatase II / sedoheptulose-1,7-bisphosphatase